MLTELMHAQQRHSYVMERSGVVAKYSSDFTSDTVIDWGDHMLWVCLVEVQWDS